MQNFQLCREVPVHREYDVLVCGGGPSGCAAAMASAREGMQTLLVEKNGYLGGATVAQFVMPVLSMNGVDFPGIWHEWARELDRLGGMGELRQRRNRLVDGSVDPELVKYAWENLLSEAGVDVLYHAHFCDVMKDAAILGGIVVSTMGGLLAIPAKRVIDCTGDAHLCAQAGVPWEQGDGKSPSAMALTKPFRLGNAKMPENFPTEEHLKKIDDDYAHAMNQREFTDPIITQGRIILYLKAWTRPLANRPEMLVGGPSRILNVNPLDPWELSRAEHTARQQIQQVKDYYLKYCPGCENAYFLDSSSQIGIRSTRRIQGVERVTKAEAFGFQKSPAAIARSSWHIDIWPADSYTTQADQSPEGWMERVKAGDWFDIPYGCIVPSGVDNLLVGGRCISADHFAQSSLRIQQTCMATGDAAGVAAAMSVRAGVSPRELDGRMVAEYVWQRRDDVRPFSGLPCKI